MITLICHIDVHYVFRLYLIVQAVQMESIEPVDVSHVIVLLLYLNRSHWNQFTCLGFYGIDG